MATLSGVVRDVNGNEAERFVRVSKRSTGALLGQTLSSASTGAWSVTVPDTSDCYVTFHDAPEYDKDYPINYRIACHWTSNSTDLMGNTVTLAGNASVSGGHMNFDGSGDYAYFPTIAAPGASDFFIRMLVTLNSTATYQYLIDYRPVSTHGLYISLYTTPGGGLDFYTDSAVRITSSSGITAGVEAEIVLCKTSGVTKAFIDGVQTGSDYIDGNTYIVGTNRPIVGAHGHTVSLYQLAGKIKEFSVVLSGRYSGAFTPSYSAFVEALSGIGENALAIDKVTPA